MDLGVVDRVALVTGASAGIGAAAARSLAEEGCRVALVARRRRVLDKLVAGWPTELVERCTVIDGDVTQSADLDRIVAETTTWGGSVDILVQSAGGSRALALDASDEQWDEAFALNFTAIRRLAHRVLPSMTERGWGRIISVTGGSEPNHMLVRPPGEGRSHLNAASAAKAALHVWAKGLSREVGAVGVTVNSVSPGRIVSEQVDASVHPDPHEREAFIAANIPLGRFGDPRECADAITFLASEKAGYVTGEIIAVDGGQRRHAF